MELKEGAQVILMRNLSRRLVNGSRGVVVGFQAMYVYARSCTCAFVLALTHSLSVKRGQCSNGRGDMITDPFHSLSHPPPFMYLSATVLRVNGSRGVQAMRAHSLSPTYPHTASHHKRSSQAGLRHSPKS